MNILSLISGVVGLFKSIAGYFADKQLINAGRAKEKAGSYEEQNERAKNARAARRVAIERLRERRGESD